MGLPSPHSGPRGGNTLGRGGGGGEDPIKAIGQISGTLFSIIALRCSQRHFKTDIQENIQ